MSANDSAAAAETAFYTAFENGDVDAMMGIWMPNGRILCIHPMGPELIDRDEIRASWLEIFAAPFKREISVEVTFEEHTADLVIRTVKEIFTVSGQVVRSAPVVATNVFQRVGDRWYIAVHHASPGVRAGSTFETAPSTATPVTRH